MKLIQKLMDGSNVTKENEFSGLYFEMLKIFDLMVFFLLLNRKLRKNLNEQGFKIIAAQHDITQ